ncbi:MAG TPA: phenylalanine--tRNA ligase subunit alpha, partial [candidate division Zixibacteria bacterium]|nr:phenylalanine--tRNA ligase subunit alpha [candidate division Zixibacteria bacterium]
MSAGSRVDTLYREALAALEGASSKAELEAVQVRYLGRKGEFSQILKSLKDLPLEERKSVGAAANQLRGEFEAALTEKLASLSGGPRVALDYTLPGQTNRIGRPHIITQTTERISAIFKRLGFDIETGPDIETDYYNFGALNFPPDHPARDMQDTFYLQESDGLPAGLLLRTHTSNVQIRAFERRKPPLKIIAPGKVFRHEAISTRAYCVF